MRLEVFLGVILLFFTLSVGGMFSTFLHHNLLLGEGTFDLISFT